MVRRAWWGVRSNDLAVVNGNLTLAGTLNVGLTPGGSFDPGIYRVISYAGTLTNNGLLLGSVPPGNHRVGSDFGGASGEPGQHDRGDAELLGRRGDGEQGQRRRRWRQWYRAELGRERQLDAERNPGHWNEAPWANASFAIFEAAPGTVTVDNSLGQVVASGMQFAVGGWHTGSRWAGHAGRDGSRVGCDACNRVGDGTAAGAGMMATIGSVLQGSTQLVKDDLGTLRC